jgi:cytosine/uracil/thiamine/allantoin permease
MRLFKAGQRFLDSGMLLVFMGLFLMSLDVLGFTKIYQGIHWHIGLVIAGVIFLVIHKATEEKKVNSQSATNSKDVHSISDYR